MIAPATTYLFSDLAGGTRLWDAAPEAMRAARVRHDASVRTRVAEHGGTVVKVSGDGAHAAFDDALRAVRAALAVQIDAVPVQAAPATVPVPSLRCGLHLGVDERRDGDFFGPAVNRAARIMGVAHGGQVLVSGAVARAVGERLDAGVTLRELGAVRLRDIDTPETVFQLVHPALRARFPALRGLVEPPHNLPPEDAPLFGRTEACAAVAARLRSHRAVTVLGPGGVGTSRVALAVAGEVRADFPDGVWHVSLADVGDEAGVTSVADVTDLAHAADGHRKSARVVTTLADALGLDLTVDGSANDGPDDRARSEADVTDALASFVHDRTLLLVLDDAEAAARECARLVKRLLQAGPGMKVLTASRTPLLIAGESVLRLDPLPVPADDAAFAASAACSLFDDRARRIDPAFRLDPDDAATRHALRAACEAVDGLPLAIALAASLAAHQGGVAALQALLAQPAQRLSVLAEPDTGTGALANTMSRHRSLHSCIAASHAMLDAREQALFRRLAVFDGGFDLAAAEAACAGAPLDAGDVLDGLSALVDRSLLQVDDDGARYRMLGTIRLYAAERRRAAGEGAA